MCQQRCLLRTDAYLWCVCVCFALQDEYNNPAGMGINGKVILTVTTIDGDDAEDVPMFENKAKSIAYDLINGETLLTVSVCSDGMLTFLILLDEYY